MANQLCREVEENSKKEKKLSFRRDYKGNWFLKKKASQFEKFIWV